MLMLIMVLAAVCAFGLVHLFELGWLNRPPTIGLQWPKGRAMRFLWVTVGVLVLIGQMPIGILLLIAGLPVCLAHLSLVDRRPAARIRADEVLGAVWQTAKANFRRFVDRTRIGPRP